MSSTGPGPPQPETLSPRIGGGALDEVLRVDIAPATEDARGRLVELKQRICQHRAPRARAGPEKVVPAAARALTTGRACGR